MMSEYNPDKYGRHPKKLAKQIIKKLKKNGELKFPIDPFKLLSMNGVTYQFKDFDKLEGIYIVPEDENDIPIVGINMNRPIQRQRFTAAHELCHHIKDRTTNICPMYEKNDIEKYADNFASELLMPRGFFDMEAQQYIENGYINFDNALRLSLYFGVSFESCVFTLAYRHNLIKGNTNPSEIKKRVKKYKPTQKIKRLELNSFIPEMMDHIINSYSYFLEYDFELIWYKFKNDYIFNESKIEGSKLEHDRVAEIITDLRINKGDSEYCTSNLQDIIETAGQADLYEYIFNNNDEIELFSILKLHRILYQYSPFPEAGGQIRQSNNRITNSEVETYEYHKIMEGLIKLDSDVKQLAFKTDKLSVAEYIEESLKIHHKLTVIHPFNDGNGRISRMFLNWLFKIKRLPPVYLKYKSKDDYYQALKQADLYNDYNPLKMVFYKEILNTMIQIHDERSLLD